MWIFQYPKIIFYYFFRIFHLDIFFSSYVTDVYREQVPCPLNSSHRQFLADPFETLHGLLGWPEDMQVVFSES